MRNSTASYILAFPFLQVHPNS